MTGDAADVLRQAADLIEQRAAEATPGPWGFTDACNPDNYGEWYAITADNGRYVAASGYEGGGVESDRDALWITTMHPGIAAMLAAWLRGCASVADRYSISYDEPNLPHRDSLDPSERNDASMLLPAIDFARAVAGEKS